jgi:hypothetical protein
LNLRGKRRKKWAAEQEPMVDRFRAQHLVLVQRQVMTEDGRTSKSNAAHNVRLVKPIVSRTPGPRAANGRTF